MPLELTPQQPPYYQVGDQISTTHYIANMIQVDVNAPTTTIYKNTIGNIIWTRTAVGKYVGTLAGAFTANKTLVITTLWTGGDALVAMAYSPNANTVNLETYDQDYVAADNNSWAIQITVYP